VTTLPTEDVEARISETLADFKGVPLVPYLWLALSVEVQRSVNLGDSAHVLTMGGGAVARFAPKAGAWDLAGGAA